MQSFHNKVGQSTLEYATLIIVSGLVLIIISPTVIRSVNAMFKVYGDNVQESVNDPLFTNEPMIQPEVGCDMGPWKWNDLSCKDTVCNEKNVFCPPGTAFKIREDKNGDSSCTECDERCVDTNNEICFEEVSDECGGTVFDVGGKPAIDEANARCEYGQRHTSFYNLGWIFNKKTNEYIYGKVLNVEESKCTDDATCVFACIGLENPETGQGSAIDSTREIFCLTNNASGSNVNDNVKVPARMDITLVEDCSLGNINKSDWCQKTCATGYELKKSTKQGGQPFECIIPVTNTGEKGIYEEPPGCGSDLTNQNTCNTWTEGEALTTGRYRNAEKIDNPNFDYYYDYLYAYPNCDFTSTKNITENCISDKQVGFLSSEPTEGLPVFKKAVGCGGELSTLSECLTLNHNAKDVFQAEQSDNLKNIYKYSDLGKSTSEIKISMRFQAYFQNCTGTNESSYPQLCTNEEGFGYLSPEPTSAESENNYAVYQESLGCGGSLSLSPTCRTKPFFSTSDFSTLPYLSFTVDRPEYRHGRPVYYDQDYWKPVEVPNDSTWQGQVSTWKNDASQWLTKCTNAAIDSPYNFNARPDPFATGHTVNDCKNPKYNSYNFDWSTESGWNKLESDRNNLLSQLGNNTIIPYYDDLSFPNITAKDPPIPDWPSLTRYGYEVGQMNYVYGALRGLQWNTQGAGAVNYDTGEMLLFDRPDWELRKKYYYSCSGNKNDPLTTPQICDNERVGWLYPNAPTTIDTP